MPSSAPRVCGHCGGVHPHGERCSIAVARHRERSARHDTKRPGARKRGYDAEWQREAKAFLARPENKHCSCGAPATVVRHKISIRRAPHMRMNRSNWQPGCHRCNAIDAARERRAEGQ